MVSCVTMWCEGKWVLPAHRGWRPVKSSKYPRSLEAYPSGDLVSPGMLAGLLKDRRLSSESFPPSYSSPSRALTSSWWLGLLLRTRAEEANESGMSELLRTGREALIKIKTSPDPRWMRSQVYIEDDGRERQRERKRESVRESEHFLEPFK